METLFLSKARNPDDVAGRNRETNGEPMSATILSRLRAWIAASGLSEGARLPPERELAATLGISRAELRKALLVMEAAGQLRREVGRGTFLTGRAERSRADPARAMVDELAERTGPHEAMMARLALEPELARMAALHASPRQLRELRRLATAMRAAPSWQAYEDLDAEFHDLLASAAGNGLLHELHKVVNGVRQVVVWRRLDTSQERPEPDYHSFEEHNAIIAALEQRNGAAAHEAMRRHLQATLAALTDRSGGGSNSPEREREAAAREDFENRVMNASEVRE